MPNAEAQNFDLIVIGSGPAGYVAAIRAAQLQMNVACIEKRNTFGGTCLNVGCIPSKALLDSSEHYANAQHEFIKHGIEVGELRLNLAQMMKRKDTVVQQLTQGIAGLFKKNKVHAITGVGRLRQGAQGIEVDVTDPDGNMRTLRAKNILLATGSEPIELPFLPFDGVHILSSTEALELTSVPQHLIVVGGGVIGLELGSVWCRLGAKVSVVEYQDHIAGNIDRQMSEALRKALTRQGLEFILNTECTGATLDPQEHRHAVHLKDRSSGATTDLVGDVILVSTGRKPYTQNLGLEEVGLQTDRTGRLGVDSHYQTKIPGIYAIGDIIDGPMLAHKAEEEGIAAVERMAGQAGHVNYRAIPNVIYTWPEFATVGASEEELKSQGVAYKSGSFPFLANGRAKAAMNATEGFVKILADEKTDRLLGMHVLGPWASDLIVEGVSVMEFGGSAEDIARSSHAHPTLSEAVREAAMAVAKRQIHL